MSAVPPSELYRATPLGRSLVQSLNVMIREGTISKEQASQVLRQFDQTVPEVIREVIPPRTREDIVVEAELSSYTYLDGLWKIDAENVTMSFGSRTRKYKRARFMFE
jgi:Transcription initiation factor IIA, gamma subunit, helical domain